MYWLILSDVPGYIGCAISLFLIYKKFFQKPKVTFAVKAIFCDIQKELHTHKLEFSIVNHSGKPIIIGDIKLFYNEKIRRANDHILNIHAEDEINRIKNTKLLQGEQITFGWDYLNPENNGEAILNSLEQIVFISTYGHKYKISSNLLKPLIKKLQKSHPNLYEFIPI